MQLSELKIPIIIVSAVIFLAVFWVGYSWYENISTEQPLVELLDDNPDVEEFTIEQDDQWFVTVQFKDVDNLKDTYVSLVEDIEKVAGNDDFSVQVMGANDDYLLQLWEILAFYVHEGASNGTFSSMREGLRQELSESDAQMSLQVDEQRIYLSLRNGENYIHRVVTRTDLERSEIVETQ